MLYCTCLRRCEARGLRRCRFASFADVDTVRRPGGRARALCLLVRRCDDLLAVTLGAATYERRWSLRRPKAAAAAPDRGGADLPVTLAPAAPADVSQGWSPQLCASRDGSAVLLRPRCEPPARGVFRLVRVGSVEEAHMRVVSFAGTELCADRGAIHLAARCGSSVWEVVANADGPEWVSSQEGHAPARLRLAAPGGSLLVHEGRCLRLEAERPAPRANSSRGASWAVVSRQPWREELLDGRRAETLRVGRPVGRPPPGPRPRVEVWLLASQSYEDLLYKQENDRNDKTRQIKQENLTIQTYNREELLSHMVETLRGLGEPARVHVRRADDLRNVSGRFWVPESYWACSSRRLLLG